MAGKGHVQRPCEIERKVFEDNWDRIFKKKKKTQESKETKKED